MLRALMLEQGLLVVLLLTRILGFVLTSPFPGEHVPRSAKVGLSVMLAFFCASTLPTPHEALDISLRLVGMVAAELGTGLTIGFSFRVLLSAADVAGDLVGQATGLGSASLFNPMFGSNETAVSRVLSLLALLLVLSSGAHRVVLAFLMDSFAAIPVGQGRPAMALPVLLAAFVDAMTVGVQLAMPVIAVSLVLQVALAMVARIAPSLQIFNVGFALLIVVGLFTLFATLRDLGTVLISHLGKLPDTLERLFESIRG